MKKQDFPLLGILKIRQYKEAMAVQQLLEDTKEDRLLASEARELAISIEQAYTIGTSMPTYEFSQEDLKYKFDYVVACQNRQREIIAQRKKLEPKVKSAYLKYNKVRLELESIKILDKNHTQNQKRIYNKSLILEIQEHLACNQTL